MVIVTTAVYWGLNSPLRPQSDLTGPLNLPAPGRRQSVYINLTVFARTCVFSKQSLPSILCDHHQQKQCKTIPPAVVPLLPKLRGHFAEFLNHSSPERLSILYLTTCVGLGYGPIMHSLEAFLDSTGSSPSTKKWSTHHASPTIQDGFTYPAGHTLTPHTNRGRDYLTASPHHLTTTNSGPNHTPPTHTKYALTACGRLVSSASSLGAHYRVREYQPVNHRLRLSASP